MNFHFAYHGRSRVEEAAGGRVLSLAPNLSREPVAFDAPLCRPLRFREAVSALHDVVTSDLRFHRRDKTAWEEWKKRRAEDESALRDRAFRDATARAELARHTKPPPELRREYRRARRAYWRARRGYGLWLYWNDPDLWRRVVPFDPVITVAEDVVFFECFSADESSYGCLTVDRDGGFGPSDVERLGTTNVDYSQDLYEHFQTLRTYRETRLRVDPSGFEVATEDDESYREEKIDLPGGWLRGFLRLQGAMGLPAHRVRLSREAVYSILAWHKRHRARKSPRALRFELLPGKPPRLVLEPWERSIVSLTTTYYGPDTAPIRIWGHRRLLALARLLPLVEDFEVWLTGTGLPSFWVARMGEMKLTLGLSGWTANDWTRGSLKPFSSVWRSHFSQMVVAPLLTM